MMRIRVVRRPTESSIDGISLDRFLVGREYEVGNSLGALMLAERWAEPVPFSDPVPEAPFSEADPHTRPPYRDKDAPPNLTREHYPPYLDELRAIAADSSARRRRR